MTHQPDKERLQNPPQSDSALANKKLPDSHDNDVAAYQVAHFLYDEFPKEMLPGELLGQTVIRLLRKLKELQTEVDNVTWQKITDFLKQEFPEARQPCEMLYQTVIRLLRRLKLPPEEQLAADIEEVRKSVDNIHNRKPVADQTEVDIQFLDVMFLFDQYSKFNKRLQRLKQLQELLSETGSEVWKELITKTEWWGHKCEYFQQASRRLPANVCSGGDDDVKHYLLTFQGKVIEKIGQEIKWYAGCPLCGKKYEGKDD